MSCTDEYQEGWVKDKTKTETWRLQNQNQDLLAQDQEKEKKNWVSTSQLPSKFTGILQHP